MKVAIEDIAFASIHLGPPARYECDQLIERVSHLLIALYRVENRFRYEVVSVSLCARMLFPSFLFSGIDSPFLPFLPFFPSEMAPWQTDSE